MTPEQIAGTSEHSHQAALYCWASLPDTRARYPLLSTPLFFAIPNGGSRGDTARSAQIVGGMLKAEGVKAGVSDCFLAVRRGDWNGLFIEMKAAKGKVSPQQKLFGEMVKDQGYGFVVCYTWEEAKNVLIQYMEWGQ